MGQANFPSNPNIGDFVFIGLYKYTWSGTAWDRTLVDVDSLSTDIIDALTGAAPQALNTLEELAAALNDDENFAVTVTNAIAEKAEVELLSGEIKDDATWTDQSGYFTSAITVNGILATDFPIIDLDLSSATVADIPDIQAEWGKIYRGVTTTDTITFHATEALELPEDIDLIIKVVR